MKFLLGTKQYMTQIFDENGDVSPVTVISATPLVVSQVKTLEKDGYKAVQFGGGLKKEKNMTKAQKGHLKDLGNFRHLKEFRVVGGEESTMVRGDKMDISIFGEGDKVTISSVSKGKGFQGVVKRHGFHGGPRSHGQKHSEREPGSISGGTRNGGRVPKGMRMAGRMGSDKITLKNLKIVKVDAENSELYIKGAIPGRKGTLVEIRG
jgi:large subunit ribosomal protein L3